MSPSPVLAQRSLPEPLGRPNNRSKVGRVCSPPGWPPETRSLAPDAGRPQLTARSAPAQVRGRVRPGQVVPCSPDRSAGRIGQIRTAPSSPALARHAPSGVIATARTRVRWPVRLVRCWSWPPRSGAFRRRQHWPAMYRPERSRPPLPPGGDRYRQYLRSTGNQHGRLRHGRRCSPSSAKQLSTVSLKEHPIRRVWRAGLPKPLHPNGVRHDQADQPGTPRDTESASWTRLRKLGLDADTGPVGSARCFPCRPERLA